MLIDIVSDTICPWCFIGKRRLEHALAQRPDLEVQIGWRPFQLNPDMPREGMDRKTYLALKFGGEERARRIYDTIRETGAEVGIDFRYDLMQRTPNTLSSHQLIRWAGSAGVQHQLVEILFRRYFLEGQDIGQSQTLVEAAGEAGMDANLVRELLEKDSDVEQVQAEDRLAREMGIQGVPFFIIDRKYAVTGAQDPAVFLQVFDYVLRGGEAGEAKAE
ncbi:MAG: DsbA family oxidoreductase [Alphaproteobacteria bacterium]|nr:DsbA family oxidoreductase [Alphaproteobacteria bacterium]